MENSEGWCAYCGKAHASESVGEDEHGNVIFVHRACERDYVRKVLSRPVTEHDRVAMMRASPPDDTSPKR